MTATRGADTRRMVVQTVLTAALLFAAIASLGAAFRPQIELLATWLVTRSGYAGMFLGSFLSDVCMFPIPPQFYMLVAVAAGAPQLPSIASCCAGSVLAAWLAYPIAGRLARVPWLLRRLEATRPRVDPLFERWGYWAVAVGAMSPVPFSWLCYLAGLYRVPFRYYGVFVLFRIPRLLVFYAVIRAGWLR